MSNEMQLQVLDIESTRIFDKEQKSYKTQLYLLTKRTMDVILSSFALILLLPVFILIALAIKLEDGGPAIYIHNRIGKNGKQFKLYKFRSMVVNPKPIEEIFTAEQLIDYKKDFKIKNDPRVTHVGKFIRQTSLDELPQLLNIICGDISIVGPRPVLLEETLRYGINRDKFLSVLPGLTGYWQVNGRSDTTYEQRIEMELYYARNRSLMLDIKIILKTIRVVLSRAGAV